MILIVDMSWKKNSIAAYEFVLPIVSAIQPIECKVEHFSDINAEELDCYSKIILSGTALKDNATLHQPEKFYWLKTCKAPVLGICAGMQTIGLVFGARLNRCLQIGMAEISTVKENGLFEGDFTAYTLHNYSVEESGVFDILAQSDECIQAIKLKEKNIYGVLFHPEVRNQDVIQRFAKAYNSTDLR